MEFDQLFNLGEGIFWILVSIALLTRIRRFPENRALLWAGSTAFFVFGLTDFIEVVTRAWYRPIPLLLLNVACVATLVACLGLYLKKRRRRNEEV